MRIAIVVPGRFHAFYFAEALARRGNDVHVFTNYPAMIVGRWGLSPRIVHGFPLHGAGVRIANKIQRRFHVGSPDRWALPSFSRWASRQLARQNWDVVHSYSGASLELLMSDSAGGGLKLLRRSSAHIAEQRRILDDEMQRTGLSIERPDDWIVERELREYELADGIVVPSSFARRTFVSKGWSEARVHLLPMAADTTMFHCTTDELRARRARILSGEALQVLYVGAVSARKGIWDMAEVLRNAKGEGFRFTFVGAVTPEAEHLISDFRQRDDIRFVGHRPEAELPAWHRKADLFVFPTLEDGFAVTIAQAVASALPVITSTNCSGPDLVTSGETGFIVPPRKPEEILEILRWCDRDREALADMCERAATAASVSRTWDDFAADFEQIVVNAQRWKRSGYRPEG